MEAINIKGKKYVTVNERLKAFRTVAEYAGYSLVTIAHELTNDVCVMEAQIKNKDGVLIANGFAREVRTQAGSLVNATSYVENCETSAWGRALANFGIGIDENICSAQELLVALGMQQSKAAEPSPKTEQQKPTDTTYIEQAKTKEKSPQARMLEEIEACKTAIELQGIQARLDKNATMSDAVRKSWQDKICEQGNKIHATKTQDGWMDDADLMSY
jgi:hypothetical protein